MRIISFHLDAGGGVGGPRRGRGVCGERGDDGCDADGLRAGAALAGRDPDRDERDCRPQGPRDLRSRRRTPARVAGIADRSAGTGGHVPLGRAITAAPSRGESCDGVLQRHRGRVIMLGRASSSVVMVHMVVQEVACEFPVTPNRVQFILLQAFSRCPRQ